MFIGHFAVGLAAKRLAPSVSLGWLILAPLFLDALWPIFLLAGVETVRIDPGNTVVTPLDLHDYPYSHSLLMAMVWSVLLGGLFFMLRRKRNAAWLLAACVFSHFVFDWITHRADMPLYPGSASYIGLGLWNSLPGTLVTEGLMFAAAVAIYANSTRPKNRKGSVLFVAYVVVLCIMYVANIFGPPPPSVAAIIISGLLMTPLFVLWAHAFDRNRTQTALTSSAAALSDGIPTAS